MKPTIFEYGLKGFDGSGRTDHLVRWVRASTAEEVDLVLNRLGLETDPAGVYRTDLPTDLAYGEGLDLDLTVEHSDEVLLAALGCEGEKP